MIKRLQRLVEVNVCVCWPWHMVKRANRVSKAAKTIIHSLSVFIVCYLARNPDVEQVLQKLKIH